MFQLFLDQLVQHYCIRYSNILDGRIKSAYCQHVLDPAKMHSIRQTLGLSQEQMARLVGVSFTSVNRWEGGHSGPTASTRDFYLALESALAAGHSPQAIREAANSERGAFLYNLFRMAYGGGVRTGR